MNESAMDAGSDRSLFYQSLLQKPSFYLAGSKKPKGKVDEEERGAETELLDNPDVKEIKKKIASFVKNEIPAEILNELLPSEKPGKNLEPIKIKPFYQDFRDFIIKKRISRENISEKLHLSELSPSNLKVISKVKHHLNPKTWLVYNELEKNFYSLSISERNSEEPVRFCEFLIAIMEQHIIMEKVNELNHPALAKYSGLFFIKEKRRLEKLISKSEYGDVTLRDILDEKAKSKKPYFTEFEILNFLKMFSNLFKNLQEQAIVHRDIKPENIYLSTLHFGTGLDKESDPFIPEKSGKPSDHEGIFEPMGNLQFSKSLSFNVEIMKRGDLASKMEELENAQPEEELKDSGSLQQSGKKVLSQSKKSKKGSSKKSSTSQKIHQINEDDEEQNENSESNDEKFKKSDKDESEEDEQFESDSASADGKPKYRRSSSQFVKPTTDDINLLDFKRRFSELGGIPKLGAILNFTKKEVLKEDEEGTANEENEGNEEGQEYEGAHRSQFGKSKSVKFDESAYGDKINLDDFKLMHRPYSAIDIPVDAFKSIPDKEKLKEIFDQEDFFPSGMDGSIGLQLLSKYKDEKYFVYLHNKKFYLDQKRLNLKGEKINTAPCYYKLSNSGCMKIHNAYFSGHIEEIMMDSCAGAVSYMSPEMRKFKARGGEGRFRYNPFKSEVFSLGLVVLEMMGIPKVELKKFIDRRIASRSDSEVEMLRMIGKLTKNAMYSSLLTGIVDKMIKIDNTRRISFQGLDDLINEKYLDEIGKDCIDNLIGTIKRIRINKALDNSPFPIKKKLLNDICNGYIEINSFSKALEIINVEYRDALNEFGGVIEDKYFAELFQRMGILEMETKQSFKRGYEYLNRSTEIFAKIEETDYRNTLINNFKKAELLYMQNHFTQCLEFYNNSLQIGLSYYETEYHPFIARIYHGIAQTFYDLGDFKTAKEKFFKSMKIEKQLLSSKKEVTYKVASLKIEIGRCLTQYNKYEEALRHFNQSWEMMSFVKQDKSDEITAEILEYMAFCYQKLSRYNEALLCYERSLKIQDRIPNSHSRSRTFERMAGLYKDKSEFPKAFDYLHRSLELRKSNLSIHKPHSLLTPMTSIAELHLLVFDYEKSLRCFLEAKRLHDKIYGFNKSTSVLSLIHSGLAKVYKDYGDFAQALNHMSLSLTVKMEILSEEFEFSPKVAVSFADIADLYRITKRFDKALELLEKSLRILADFQKKVREEKSKTQEDLLCYIHIYETFGLLNMDMGKYDQALYFFNKSHDIGRVIMGGENYRVVANTLGRIGSLYYITKDYAKALSFYGRSLGILESIYGGKDNYDSAVALYNLGHVFHALLRTEKALVYYFTSLEILDKILGKRETALTTEIRNNIQDIKKTDIYLKN